MRDYERAAQILKCGDDLLLTTQEVALLIGYAPETIRQRAVPFFPAPLSAGRLLRWRLGDVRAWLANPTGNARSGRALPRNSARP